ncbi:MAG: hypothetical protein IKK08_07960 [Clostridia bacterium]|nr:hypothetical protein [Clostridia bacterium]
MEDFKDKQIVQRVIDNSLSGIQDDPRMAQRVLRIAHEKEGKKMNKKTFGRNPSKLVILVLTLVLVFATTAFALTRPAVLSWLIGNAPVSLQLESTAQTVIGENSVDGITVRMTSLVFDGEKLAFSYEMENDQPDLPVLIAANPMMSFDGKEVQMMYCTADPYAPQMVPSPHLDVLPVKRNPVVGGGEVYVSDITKGKVTCEMTFVVYKPENKFAVALLPDSMQANVESYTGDARSEAEDSLHTLKSFRNAIFATEADLVNEQWLAEGYTVIDGSGMLYDLPDNSHLNETAQIKVTFEFDASVAFACDFAETDDVELADATLHVEQFRLSSLETRIDLWMIPQENSEKAARSLAEKYGAYTLIDEQGKTVQYSEMDYMAAATPYITQINGQWVCRYLSQMPGLLRFPESVAFTVGDEELIHFNLMMEE